MKLDRSENGAEYNIGSTFKIVCLGSCQKILAQIKRVKDGIVTESRETLGTQQRLVHLALNEAEALALDTSYPHLLFPTLAMEKVQEVARWNEHQQAVRRVNLIPALAA